MTNPKPALAWVAIIALGSPFEVPLWGVGVRFWSVYRGASDICAGVLTPVMSSLNLRARRGIQATLGVFSPLRALTFVLKALRVGVMQMAGR